MFEYYAFRTRRPSKNYIIPKIFQNTVQYVQNSAKGLICNLYTLMHCFALQLWHLIMLLRQDGLDNYSSNYTTLVTNFEVTLAVVDVGLYRVH